MIPHAFFLDQDFSLKQLLSERRQESVRGSEVDFKSASLNQQFTINLDCQTGAHAEGRWFLWNVPAEEKSPHQKNIINFPAPPRVRGVPVLSRSVQPATASLTRNSQKKTG